MTTPEGFPERFSAIVGEVRAARDSLTVADAEVVRLDAEYRHSLEEAQVMGREAARLLVETPGVSPDFIVPRADFGRSQTNLAQAGHQAWRLPSRQLGARYRQARSADDAGLLPDYFYSYPVVVEGEGLCISPPQLEGDGEPTHYRQYDPVNCVSRQITAYQRLNVAQSIDIERDVQKDIVRILLRRGLI